MTIGAPIYSPASPIEIRDGTAERLAAVTGLKEVFKSRSIPVKDDQMPYAAVWIASDRTEANGDSDVGSPSFVHSIMLIVDVGARAASDAALDTLITGLVETIRATLMTDFTWVNLFEGIERCDARYSYPKETNNIVAEAIIEIEVTIRSEWPPYVPNDFGTVSVRTNDPDDPSPFNGFATQFDIPETSP